MSFIFSGTPCTLPFVSYDEDTDFFRKVFCCSLILFLLRVRDFINKRNRDDNLHNLVTIWLNHMMT